MPMRSIFMALVMIMGLMSSAGADTFDMDNSENMATLKNNIIHDIDLGTVIGRGVVIDTETTGLGLDDKIVQFAAQKVEFVEVGDEAGNTYIKYRFGEIFNRYFNPGEDFLKSPSRQAHKISSGFLRPHGSFEDSFRDILAFLEGHMIYAYNADFDIRMLSQELETLLASDEEVVLRYKCLMGMNKRQHQRATNPSASVISPAPKERVVSYSSPRSIKARNTATRVRNTQINERRKRAREEKASSQSSSQENDVPLVNMSSGPSSSSSSSGGSPESLSQKKAPGFRLCDLADRAGVSPLFAAHILRVVHVFKDHIEKNGLSAGELHDALSDVFVTHIAALATQTPKRVASTSRIAHGEGTVVRSLWSELSDAFTLNNDQAEALEDYEERSMWQECVDDYLIFGH